MATGTVSWNTIKIGVTSFVTWFKDHEICKLGHIIDSNKWPGKGAIFMSRDYNIPGHQMISLAYQPRSVPYPTWNVQCSTCQKTPPKIWTCSFKRSQNVSGLRNIKCHECPGNKAVLIYAGSNHLRHHRTTTEERLFMISVAKIVLTL